MKIPEDKSLPKSELTATPHSNSACQPKSTASNYAAVPNAIPAQPVTKANLFRLSPPRYHPGSIELVQIWLDATTDPCPEEAARGPQCSEECSWGPLPRDGPHGYLWDALAGSHCYPSVHRIHTESYLTRNPPRIGQRRNHPYDDKHTSASPSLDDIDTEAAISDTETVIRIPPVDESLK